MIWKNYSLRTLLLATCLVSIAIAIGRTSYYNFYFYPLDDAIVSLNDAVNSKQRSRPRITKEIILGAIESHLEESAQRDTAKEIDRRISVICDDILRTHKMPVNSGFKISDGSLSMIISISPNTPSHEIYLTNVATFGQPATSPHSNEHK